MSMSGFRKGHSTVTTLLGIRDDITRAVRRGEETLLVFADYSKAFDHFENALNGFFEEIPLLDS